MLALFGFCLFGLGELFGREDESLGVDDLVVVVCLVLSVVIIQIGVSLKLSEGLSKLLHDIHSQSHEGQNDHVERNCDRGLQLVKHGLAIVLLLALVSEKGNREASSANQDQSCAVVLPDPFLIKEVHG